MSSPDGRSPQELRIEEQLRQAFAVPEGAGARLAESVRQSADSIGAAAPQHATADDPVPPGVPSRGTPPSVRRFPRHWLSAAALLFGALALGGWWWAGGLSDPPLTPGPAAPDAGQLYVQVLKRARDQAGACLGEDLLSQRVLQSCGQALHIEAGLGLSSPVDCDQLPGAMALASLLPIEPAVLIIHALEQDPGLVAIDGDDLRVFRRVLGQLVVYELTKQDQPSCLDSLRLVDPPPRPDALR